jgi:DNA-binding transcriptional LysR family regulator
VTTQQHEWLSAIAGGYGVAIAPASAARFAAGPGVVYRQLRGVSPSRVGVAWAPADDASTSVRLFVRCCVEIVGGTP